MNVTEYIPVDAIRFEQMLQFARQQESRELLNRCAFAWLLDLSIPRVDIAAVVSFVEKEKGWTQF
jgi:hypothetical protein